ncbi:ATP-dependent Clp protease ATP-binding subunit ClpX [Alphaproteobacteria bacterium endosymbiont of Tiliacea citrago]|uniref:ATP-dependent Clp protease ATP-binding subunit ClpX n=1 Tax=Alphaproteobacteria bacterium endosymbiont of Tiliacea citrago TaxID=3077944 RepID=UPI00313BF8F3
MNPKNVCSFCQKDNLKVEKLIAGKNASICNECLELALEALKQEKNEANIDEDFWDISPKFLKNEFDKFVIGQEDAKKQLAVVVSNHYKRLLFQSSDVLQEGKVNLLMIGPTSSGKTLLLKVLQKLFSKKGIPIAFSDATTLTEAGYVGEDVETMLLRLLQECDFNVEKAQKGIIFIDEIDKIATKNSAGSLSRDVSGEGVQHALLGILQGKIANVTPGSKKSIGQETIQIDTSDILFICAGAFSGLEKIIDNRTNISSIGLHAQIKEKNDLKTYSNVETEDLIKYGMIPEFVGRLPSVVTLQELSKEQLINVLTKPDNAIIKQYQQLFKCSNCELIFTDEALDEIATLTLKKKISTRGLKGVIEKILTETMFELETLKPCKVVVTRESVRTNKVEIQHVNDGFIETLEDTKSSKIFR